ncbi:MAG: aldehyde dehydrogenase family protein, partial [Armatimonadetes bacterium]|nr:aldehyde dehydrogenase family protein [Armatimonadota bacterium]
MRHEMYINGEWTDALSGAARTVRNPATEEGIGEVAYGGRADCERAIEAAAKAFPAWSRMTPYERGAILKQAAERIRAEIEALAHLTVEESGKPLLEARGEWKVAADL